MKFINFAIIKFSGFLTLGILAAYYFPSLDIPLLPTLTSCFVVLCIAWRMARKKLVQSIYFGATTYVCFFIIGFVNYELRQPQQQPDHFYHELSTSEGAHTKIKLIQLQVSEVLRPDAYNDKFIGEVYAVDGQKKHGKLLLQLAKDSCRGGVAVDDQLMVYSDILAIPKPKNPHQFDYRKYMESMLVFGQSRIIHRDIVMHHKRTKSLKGFAENLRSLLIQKLKVAGLGKEERIIVQALTLGERREISRETNAQYAAAGAIHILAVSGLHVGIVFMLFRFLFAPLGTSRLGKIFRAILLILSLFGFALLAGLSPSVLRAATMFSLFIFAELSNRRTNSINTLFISYFGLLVINPTWLLQVGFQLSYLAVFFILWIQPKMYRLCTPKNYFLRSFWGIITVSLAAQIGVLPLSLYYFHQFPGLFLLTNLVVLPLITIILLGGIVLLILALFEYAPSWYLQFYSEVISNLNGFIAWAANQKRFLFEDITFSAWQVLSTYLVLISMAALWKKPNYSRIIVVLGSFTLFLGILLSEKFRYSRNEMVIFHKNRQSLITLKQDFHLQILTSDTSVSVRNNYPIKSYYTAVGATSASEEVLPKVFRYKNKKMLIIDSLGVYPNVTGIEIVVLTQSPKINLDRLLDYLSPELIIADGSNYPSFISRWEQTCHKKKLPFHHTGAKGALIFE